MQMDIPQSQKLFSRQGAVAFLIFFAIYGGVIELIQPLVNRHGEWVDLIANTTGLMVGCLIAILTIQIKAKNSKP